MPAAPQAARAAGAAPIEPEVPQAKGKRGRKQPSEKAKAAVEPTGSARVAPDRSVAPTVPATATAANSRTQAPATKPKEPATPPQASTKPLVSPSPMEPTRVKEPTLTPQASATPTKPAEPVGTSIMRAFRTVTQAMSPAAAQATSKRDGEAVAVAATPSQAVVPVIPEQKRPEPTQSASPGKEPVPTAPQPIVAPSPSPSWMQRFSGGDNPKAKTSFNAQLKASDSRAPADRRQLLKTLAEQTQQLAKGDRQKAADAIGVKWRAAYKAEVKAISARPSGERRVLLVDMLPMMGKPQLAVYGADGSLRSHSYVDFQFATLMKASDLLAPADQHAYLTRLEELAVTLPTEDGRNRQKVQKDIASRQKAWVSTAASVERERQDAQDAQAGQKEGAQKGIAASSHGDVVSKAVAPLTPTSVVPKVQEAAIVVGDPVSLAPAVAVLLTGTSVAQTQQEEKAEKEVRKADVAVSSPQQAPNDPAVSITPPQRELKVHEEAANALASASRVSVSTLAGEPVTLEKADVVAHDPRGAIKTRKEPTPIPEGKPIVRREVSIMRPTAERTQAETTPAVDQGERNAQLAASVSPEASLAPIQEVKQEEPMEREQTVASNLPEQEVTAAPTGEGPRPPEDEAANAPASASRVNVSTLAGEPVTFKKADVVAHDPKGAIKTRKEPTPVPEGKPIVRREVSIMRPTAERTQAETTPAVDQGERNAQLAASVSPEALTLSKLEVKQESPRWSASRR
jgi:hypothetical protein